MKIDIEKYPHYLRHDIEEIIKAEGKESATGEKCYHMDCLQDELYSSLGSAYREKVIGKEEAQYLYKRYLGIDVVLE